ncbi:spore germination protein [Aquibacillus albus]|uniref:Spore germination protein PA n=1 Tax=Aquibacillus albus TaxID=1168171 RepID=A0ABS2N006_9BACI|nr:spore germination protein [Aquibacillus albus]MBM7571498.1 spore germination protein PA [Aquibacillus albus]
MPAIVGAVKVITIDAASIFNIGDVYGMSPYAQAKTFAGGGSFNTGDGIRVELDYSSTNVYDKDNFDQIISGT